MPTSHWTFRLFLTVSTIEAGTTTRSNTTARFRHRLAMLIGRGSNNCCVTAEGNPTESYRVDLMNKPRHTCTSTERPFNDAPSSPSRRDFLWRLGGGLGGVAL